MGFCPMSHGEPVDLCMAHPFFFDAPDPERTAEAEDTHKGLERNTNGVLRTALPEATALNKS